MASQIVILRGESIKIDDDFHINWADKGKNWVDAWCPNTVHAVIWNSLPGPNEIQSKDPSTMMMTGNTALNSTSDAVGSTTVAALLTWAETRQLQIEEAKIDLLAAVNDENVEVAGDKTWRDYDPNYS